MDLAYNPSKQLLKLINPKSHMRIFTWRIHSLNLSLEHPPSLKSHYWNMWLLLCQTPRQNLRQKSPFTIDNVVFLPVINQARWLIKSSVYFPPTAQIQFVFACIVEISARREEGITKKRYSASHMGQCLFSQASVNAMSKGEESQTDIRTKT